MYRSFDWFNLDGAGGTEILSQKPNSINICGTRYPAWISGGLPTQQDEKTEAELCFYKSERQNCIKFSKIFIHKCENFLVYKMSGRPDFQSVSFGSPATFPLYCTQFPKVVPKEPSPCSKHEVLTTTTAMLATSGYEQGSETDQYHDIRGLYQYQVKDWFQLVGVGGTEILEHKPNGINVCGTRYPGWINFNGKVPRQDENLETVVCHKNERSDCYRSSTVFVRKCENFLVYQFPEFNLVEFPAALFCTQKPGTTPPVTPSPGKPERVTPPPEKPEPVTQSPEKPERVTPRPGKPKPVTPAPEKPDMCAKKPCGMNGICYKIGLGYECVCKAGFSGPHCKTNIDDCASSPCLYGGMCVDGVDNYKCVCPKGRTGKNCDTNTNDCVSNKCQNGGKCVDSVNGYFCLCTLGFSGPRCQTNENNCGRNPCKNGGTCRDGINTYSCRCSSDFEGGNCEEKISKCKSGPCRNGGTCIDQGNTYKCSCPSGYSGKNCETKFTHCDSNPCKHGGKCVSSENSFSCTCLPGWSGRTCEDDKKIKEIADDINKATEDDDSFSLKDLLEKVKNGLDYLSGKDSDNGDSLTDKLGKKMEDSINNYLKKKYEKVFDKLKSKFPKKCGDFNLGNAVNHFKKGYQNCLNNRRKKCQEEGKKEREENGEKDEEEEEDKNEDKEEEKEKENENENENEEENESCDDKCPALKDVPNGRYVGSNFDCGHSVTFTCDDGYEMNGCETPECKITCEKGGKWSSQPPTCERKTCGGFIILSPTNPQTTLTIPRPKEQAQSIVDCTWVVISSQQNELNIDFPGSFTSISISRYNCANHFVEIGLGSETTRICQRQRAYHRSFPNMMTIRFYSKDSSKVTFNSRVSIVKGYYETARMNALLSTRDPSRKKKKPWCEVQVNDKKKWPDNAPIIMTATNTVTFPDSDIILDLSSYLKASCMTKSFVKYPKAPFLSVECIHNDKVKITFKVLASASTSRGKSWKETIDEVRFAQLGCDGVPDPKVEKEPTSTTHKFVWEIDGGTVPVIDEIKFNPGTKIPKYASHTLRGESISVNKEGDGSRPSSFRYTPKIPPADQMDPDIYPVKEQKCMFGSIHPSLKDKIDCCESNYLVHGHLVPNADFFYKSWRDATFYMTNVAPQWQAINNGNWKLVEKAVREYAKLKKQDVMITTGTHGVLKIDKHDIILPATPPAPPAPPVPSHFWKILHDPVAKAAVGFVVSNNPYASEEPGSPGLPKVADRICPTQCSLLKGLSSNPTPAKGLLMCCSVSDLAGKIKDLPTFPSVANLFTSPELQKVLKNVN